MNSNLDGKALLEALMLGSMRKDGDPKVNKILEVLMRHGHGLFDAMSIMVEIGAVVAEDKE